MTGQSHQSPATTTTGQSDLFAWKTLEGVFRGLKFRDWSPATLTLRLNQVLVVIFVEHRVGKIEVTDRCAPMVLLG